MTFIASLVGAASTALDRFSDQAGWSRKNESGQFASVLANVAATGSKAAGRGNRDLSVADDVGNTRSPAEHDEPGLDEARSASAPTAKADAAREAAARDGVFSGSGAPSAAAATAEEKTEDVAAAESSAATTVASADVRSVNRNLDSLVPEFRERLDRVMSRMKSEFGHSVTVVEAQRSQDRQNFLYEQGRSRPGNIVTWTRNSNHLTGRAADVMIDGTYNNAVGYKRLAQIAAEEGLHTLGAKDPGHVELPRGVDGGGPAPQPSIPAGVFAALPAEALEMAGASGMARVADVAAVAELASVAQVADVARVAEVARVADPMRPALTTAAADLSAVAATLATRSGGDTNSSGEGSSGQQGGDSPLASTIEAELLRGDPSLGRVFSLNSSFEAAGVSGTDAVQRAAQILALKEGGATAPVNHLLLRLDNAAGGEDRIRVDLRGGTVGTTLSIENSGEAERLAARVGELRQSLERHGLEAESVRIRTTPVSTDRVDPARAALATAELETARSGSSRSNADSSQREGWKESQGQQLRRESGDSRQRSRKEQPNEDKA